MWQISAALGVALVIAGGAFKMYYDKSEAEKEAMATQLQQSIDNQQRLENDGGKQRSQRKGRRATQ